MGGGLHFLVEIELKMAKMPAFTNLKHIVTGMILTYFVRHQNPTFIYVISC